MAASFGASAVIGGLALFTLKSKTGGAMVASLLRDASYSGRLSGKMQHVAESARSFVLNENGLSFENYGYSARTLNRMKNQVQPLAKSAGAIDEQGNVLDR